MTRFLRSLFHRRREPMRSLCGYSLHTRLVVALIDASDRQSALR